MIDQEARFDGFYALCTDLEDPAPAIIELNGGRWIIENGFRIMKTDFDARPVYVRRMTASRPTSSHASWHCWYTSIWRRK